MSIAKRQLENTPKFSRPTQRFIDRVAQHSNVKARPSQSVCPPSIYVWGGAGGCNRISQSSASGQVDDPAAPSGESRNEILELQVVKFYKINISGRVAIFGTSLLEQLMHICRRFDCRHV